MAFCFGAVTDVTIEAIVKKAVLYANDDNVNSMVLNLDKLRHFMFLKDKKSFESKKINSLTVAAYNQESHRVGFFKSCDLER